ncbi:MAG: prepilin-type N-terminal cleavage/methylation domain-containing protein [Candidatus Liptonbacteria bacterium]|nr:prepilin-type N-terminal cleavage/methylation domain-containing protein [Candidatus Liptonbacteria bacterium]
MGHFIHRGSPKKYPRVREARRGQALVELLVALSVLTVGLLALFSLLSRSLSTLRIVRDNYTATYLASEGVEVLKNLVDAGVLDMLRGESARWDRDVPEGYYEVSYDSMAFGAQIADVGNGPEAALQGAQPLTFDPSTGFYGYGGGDPTPFRRVVRVEKVDADPQTPEREIQEIAVNAFVAWETRGASFTINAEGHFFNWTPFVGTP